MDDGAPPNVDGLLWALYYPAGGTPKPIAASERPDDGWTWVHYDLVHSGAAGAIGADAHLPDLAKAALTGRDDTPRMIAGDDVVTGVLPAFAAGGVEEPDQLVGWHFAILPDRLVTGRRFPVRSLQAAREAAGRGHAPDSPVALIAEALTDFAQEMRRRVAALAEDLDAAEDLLLTPDERADLTGLGRRIGAVRRAASRLRRPLAPIARLLENDIDDLPHWIVQCAPHDAALRQTLAAIDDLNALQERGRVLQDELAARQSEVTNRRLYIVSVVTTLFMPASLVSGVFGMNTGGMYLSSWPYGTDLAIGICVLSAVVTWWLMRRGKLI